MSLVYSLYIIFCVVCEYPGRGVAGDLSSRLAHYETLHHRDVSHVIHRRHAVTQTPHRRDVHFKTLGRDFHLYLKSDHHILAPDFEAFAVDSQGSKTNFAVDPDAFYSGFIKGEYHSTVEAYWEDENLHAVIHTPRDVYYVEPSWRHLSKTDNHTMITYRASDVKRQWDKIHANHQWEKICANEDDSVEITMLDIPNEDSHLPEQKPEIKKARKRRSSDVRLVCPLLLVADYKFYREIGLHSLSKTASYLVSLINRVNNYYQKTMFGSYNVGFEIQQLRIHEEPTPASCTVDYLCHYNMAKTDWDYRKLLKAFSRGGDDFGEFCLTHLFTYENMGPINGLANVASARKVGVAGICARGYRRPEISTIYFPNTGWTTGMDQKGQRRLTLEADLITTHELGHNLGSDHDPDTEECTPNSFHGGKYIMYAYSTSGFETNNELFSPCSRRSITTVLSGVINKLRSCLREPREGFCGNYRIDKGENCDAGFNGLKDTDPCCDKTCKLRTGKQCSDYNSACCKNCVYATKMTVCTKQPNETLSCQGDWYCNEVTGKCDEPTEVTSTNGKLCVENGQCVNGTCIAYCETLGLVSCMCDEVKDACYFCCKKNKTSLCVKHLQGVVVPDYRPCYQGYCKSGVCQKQTQDFIERLWSIIENIDSDFVVEFMKDNIVGTIIVFSMIIWIPVSCYISHIDKKRLKEEQHGTMVREANDRDPRISNIQISNKTRFRNATNV